MWFCARRRREASGVGGSRLGDSVMPNKESSMSDQTRKAPGGAGPSKNRTAVKYTPNVTPLIDVMFLLLLFFLLTTRFRVEEGTIPGTLPKLPGSGSVELDRDLGLNVYVRPLGDAGVSASYEVGNSGEVITDAQQLYTRLASPMPLLDARRSQVPVTIRARSDVRWQFVLEAYNQASSAKFQKISIHRES
jgi:biopolymer transport protein ExbD